MPAGAKLLGLGLLIIAMTVWVDSPARLGVAAGIVLVGALSARLNVWALIRQLRQVLWVVGFIFALQIVLTDWRRALVVCGVLLLAVALAAMVTLTTRTTDMLDSATRAMTPLARFGFPVRQVAIALALTIRSIPLLLEIFRQVDVGTSGARAARQPAGRVRTRHCRCTQGRRRLQRGAHRPRTRLTRYRGPDPC